MSDSELSVRAADRGTEIFVIDRSFQRVAQGTGRLDVALEPGFYKVKLVSGGSIEEQLVEVAAGERTLVEPPPLSFRTSAPLVSTRRSDERQREAARKHATRVDLTLGGGAQLLVFARDAEAFERDEARAAFERGSARAPDQRAESAPSSSDDGEDGGDPESDSGAHRHAPWTGLQLRDHRRTLVDFATHAAVERDRVRAFAAANVALEPGTYHLTVDTKVWGVQKMPVVLCAGWQTQVFLASKSMRRAGRSHQRWISRTARRADLFSASIFLVREGRGFDPGSEWERLTELARLALVSGRHVLASGDLNELLHEKFENPMLGLFGAHLLLMRETPDRALVSTVLERLERLIPGHPDLRALRLANGEGGEDFPTPPMLRRSFDALVAASAERPDLIPASSFTSALAPKLIGEGPWLTWRGKPRVRRARREVDEARDPRERLRDLLARLRNAKSREDVSMSAVQRALFGLVAPAEAWSAAGKPGAVPRRESQSTPARPRPEREPPRRPPTPRPSSEDVSDSPSDTSDHEDEGGAFGVVEPDEFDEILDGDLELVRESAAGSEGSPADAASPPSESSPGERPHPADLPDGAELVRRLRVPFSTLVEESRALLEKLEGGAD